MLLFILNPVSVVGLLVITPEAIVTRRSRAGWTSFDDFLDFGVVTRQDEVLWRRKYFYYQRRRSVTVKLNSVVKC